MRIGTLQETVLDYIRDEYPCTKAKTDDRLINYISNMQKSTYEKATIKKCFRDLVKAGIIYRVESNFNPDRFDYYVDKNHPDIQPLITDFNKRYGRFGLKY